MSRPLEVVVVPRDLYYHEADYVRRLEALVKAGEALINSMLPSIPQGLEKETQELKDKWDMLVEQHVEKTNAND